MSHKKKSEPALSLPDVKTVINKWLHLDDDRIVDVMLAIVVANDLASDPSWLLLVGPPAHAKTEVLRSLDGHPKTHFLSNMTPTTLVSGLKPKGNLPDPSLLPRLNDKTLVLKDFTTIPSMRNEAQAEVLAQFREVYDGSYCKAFGNGKEVNWKGHVGLLGAVTPVIDRYHSVIGTLGDRFLLYRIGDADGKDIGRRAQKMVGQEDVMREEIRNVVHAFLNQLDTQPQMNLETDDRINDMIVDLSVFISKGRCPVDRDHRTRTVTYVPQPEGTGRVIKQLMQLGIGLAIVQNKTGFDMGIYDILRKVARDLLPATRLKILQYLYENKVFEYLKERRTTREIAVAVNLPGSTTKLLLEDLSLVDMLNREMEGDTEKAAYRWQMNDETADIIRDAQVFSSEDVIPF